MIVMMWCHPFQVQEKMDELYQKFVKDFQTMLCVHDSHDVVSSILGAGGDGQTVPEVCEGLSDYALRT